MTEGRRASARQLRWQPLHHLSDGPPPRDKLGEELGLIGSTKSTKDQNMTLARIIEKSKNAMQSGRYGTGQWLLEFNPADPQRPDPLMGWAGSTDTRRQLNLTFPTLHAAKAYADKNSIDYTVVHAAPKVLKFQAYADNFK